MLNNLLSRDDLPMLAERVRRGQGPRILRPLISANKTHRVDHRPHVQSRPCCWDSLNAIRARWNRRVSSDPTRTIQDYVATQYLSGRNDWIGLSLACGSGAEEVEWARTGRFALVDAFDVSERRIERARQRAENVGADEHLRFDVGELQDFDIPDSSYDVVVAFNALSHIKKLRRTIRRLNRILKPDGFLIVRDYVGPNRFQWSRREFEAAEEMLAGLPTRYRIKWRSGSVKHKILRPGRMLMALSDPMEAVKSSKLVGLLDRTFEQVERKDIGASVLPLVLKDIPHNFARRDANADQCLEQMIQSEDELLAEGKVRNNYVFGVWRKRS